MKAGTRPITGMKAVFDRFDVIQTRLAGFSGLTGDVLVNTWLPTGSSCTELKVLADRVAAEYPDCDATRLAEKVREIVTEPDIPDVVPDVRIMSLHKSKGLSANVVIIAGCVEGVMPRNRQKDMTDVEYEESIEEYRRLSFVGLTRVKAAPTDGRPGHLIISASRKVPAAIAMKGVAIAGWEGKMARTINSRFLAELGPYSPNPVTP
jgi:superfamily I DNA/RNA helicase